MGKGSAGREARRARKSEEEREARIKKGTVDIRAMFDQKFNGQYYDRALKEQKGAYADEFNTQWETARKGLEAALMRSGLYDSTVGAQKLAAAGKEKDLRQLDVNQRALSAVEGRRANISAAQDNVIGQLRASGDMNAASAGAAAQLAQQSQPIPYSPLGSVFTDFTAGLATQAEQERQGTNRYNLGISTWANPNRYTTNVKG